ncbi:MAG: T9SS type A sorting domain-containing protein, partial [Bacteroidetes bacterium]|nr:T9SS type A sorting domain-containing protein [Bacteroidota bacterium]
RTNGYVNGNLQRAVATGTNTYLYAVGTTAGYAPASFAFNSVGTGGNITVATADGAGPNYPSSLHATKKLGRYWSATNSGVAGYNTTTSSATFTYLTSPSDLLGGASSSNLKAYVYNGSTSYAVSNSNTSNSFTLNGFSDIGEFGAGECKGTLAPTFVKTMASSCGGGADGTITVTPAGGTSPYTYSWTSNPSGFTSTSAAITGLSPRDYTVVVTEATTCSATIQDITIWQALAPTITHSGTSSSACGNTGSIIVYAANGVAPFTYSLDGTTYQAGSTFTNLAAGTYTIYVKDLGGCVSTKPNVVVSGASPIVVTSYATAASSCANNGSIQLFRTGGTGPYTYSLDDVTYQGSNVFTNLAGNANYTGWVKDSKGCKSSLANIFVGKATAISVTQTHTNTSACASNGTISLTGAGGVPPYTYSITGAAGPYQSGNSFTGVAAGSYTAWIQDSKGCKANVGVTISSDAPIVVTATASDAGGCNNAGKIQLFRTGGVGPYTYSLDNVTYQSSNTFTGLASGTYTGYVKDSKTCVGSLANITVTANTAALSVTAGSSASSSCVNDGTIQLRAAGGVAPYTYSIDNVTYQSGATFTGVAAGTYTGYVKDVNNCSASVSVTVAGNSITVTAYAVSASDCEVSNGSIQLFRTGGTGPYTYSIDGTNYVAGNTFTNLTAGTYTGYVKDSKGCVGTLASIVVGPNNCLPPIAATKNAAAKAGLNTAVKVQAYPNPSVSEFTLSLSGFAKGKVSITIVDMMGRKVGYAETSNSQYRFGSNLRAGIYNVLVQQGDLKQSIKLVKE